MQDGREHIWEDGREHIWGVCVLEIGVYFFKSHFSHNNGLAGGVQLQKAM
jgi:hypothetical protein